MSHLTNSCGREWNSLSRAKGQRIETRWNHDSPAANEEAIVKSIADGAQGLIITPPISE